jgi:hypothetical protein
MLPLPFFELQKAFEAIILNVAPNSRLVAGLRTKAAAVLSNYKRQINDLKSGKCNCATACA